MAGKVNAIIYPVKDLNRSKELYRVLLGVEPYADAPFYVGFRIDGQEVGLNPSGHAEGMTAPIGYVQVDDIKAALAELVAAGAETVMEPTDVGGGKLIARVKDFDGNVTGLMQ